MSRCSWSRQPHRSSALPSPSASSPPPKQCPASALFGAGITLLTLDFIAVGGLTSQLFGTRRRASGAAGLALGATFLLRMVADGSSGLGWLRWFTPFGWLEELRPFADERAFLLALLAALAVGLGGLALALSRQRDLGDGIVRSATPRAPSPLLQSPLGFQWRQGLGGLVGWGLALVVTGLVIGGITSAFIATSPRTRTCRTSSVASASATSGPRPASWGRWMCSWNGGRCRSS